VPVLRQLLNGRFLAFLLVVSEKTFFLGTSTCLAEK
jgi:hypothetical protein